jgi:preprotein translocase subunit YajC
MMKQGDRVKLLGELAMYGTVLSAPRDGQVSVLLDDGSAVTVELARVAQVPALADD